MQPYIKRNFQLISESQEPQGSEGPCEVPRHVVGINTAIIAMAQGIGFAIPADTAKWVLLQLLRHGRVRRGYLGITGRDRVVDRRLTRFHQLAHDRAVEVISIEPTGPASSASVHFGDLIVPINNRSVSSVDDLHRFFVDWHIEDPVAITVLRGGLRLVLTGKPVELVG